MKKPGWKSALAGLIILFAGLFSHAQFKNSSRDYNFLRKYHRWGITLGGNVYFNNKISPAPSTAFMQYQTHLMWGYTLGLAYNIRFSNHFGLRIRLMGDKIPVYKMKYALPSAETADGKAFEDNIRSKGNPWAIRLPVGLEYRNFLIDRYILFFQAGVDAGYVFGFADARTHNAYLSTLFSSSPGFKIDPYFSIGWYYEFPVVLWQTEIIFRPHFGTPYFQGAYASGNYKTAPAEAGLISQQGSYIGLQFTWYLYKPASRVQANCPGSVQSKIVRKRQKAKERAKRRAEKMAEKQRKKAERRNKRKHRRKKRFIIF